LHKPLSMSQKDTIKFLELRKREIMQQAQKEIDALDTTIAILGRAGGMVSSVVDTITKAVKSVTAPKGKRGRKKGSTNVASKVATTTQTGEPKRKAGRPPKAASAASPALPKATKATKAPKAAKPTKPAGVKGKRGRKPAGDGSIVETVYNAISMNNKFIKASSIYDRLQKQFPDKKGPQFKVQLSSVLNGLSKKGRIKLNKYGNSNKDTAWGLPDWLDEKGAVKAERAL
jgi:hypothetical protein